MRETLEIFVMIRMLLLVTVVGFPAQHRRLQLSIDGGEIVSGPESSLHQEYQVHAEKPQLCEDRGSESFVVEPDLLGDLLKHFNPSSCCLRELKVDLTTSLNTKITPIIRFQVAT